MDPRQSKAGRPVKPNQHRNTGISDGGLYRTHQVRVWFPHAVLAKDRLGGLLCVLARPVLEGVAADVGEFPALRTPREVPQIPVAPIGGADGAENVLCDGALQHGVVRLVHQRVVGVDDARGLATLRVDGRAGRAHATQRRVNGAEALEGGILRVGQVEGELDRVAQLEGEGDVLGPRLSRLLGENIAQAQGQLVDPGALAAVGRGRVGGAQVEAGEEVGHGGRRRS